MKRISFLAIISKVVIIGCLLIALKSSGQEPTQDVQRWFQQKQWLGGLQLQPHMSVDKTTFAKQYQVNKNYWDEAFSFLKTHDLKTMAPGKYPVDGDNVYAMITENPTKNMDSAKWESHRNYVDLHMVISGEEKIGVAPVNKLNITMPYDATKDLINYAGEGTFYTAKPGTFFLFFPQDAHRPNITTGGNKADKKVVIKIRYTE